MTNAKRLLFQIILWGLIWLILAIAQNLELPFLKENLPVYLLQIGLVAFLVYYAAPLFFEKKRYIKFALISIAIIVTTSLFIDILLKSPKANRPRPFPRIERGLSPPIFPRLTNALLLSFAYLLGLFVEGIYFLQKKEQETILIKNEALHSELKLLKSQINPHFLFNVLNNIYALAAFDASKTQQSISYLSDMLRYVIYDCERPLVSLEKEVKYMENYIKLFSLKSSQEYPIRTEFQIIDPTIKIAPMVLIPFVENTFKHSHIEKIKDAFIDISLIVTKEKIYFETKNSMPGKRVSKDGVGGIGLENVVKRLAILYPEKHKLLVEQKENTFIVKLTINPKKDA